MSLVEATVILMVLATLTAVLSPSLQDFVDDAKRTKAKEDCEAIGIGIMRLLRDTGSPFLLYDGSASIDTRYYMDNRADLVVGDGDIPAADGTGDSGAMNVAQVTEWDLPADEPGVDSLYDQLVDNSPGYIGPTTPFDVNDPESPTGRGKRAGFGWRGAYLSGIVSPDPWSFRYAVNSVFLGSATDATDDDEGAHDRGWTYDAFCVSPGPNGLIEAEYRATASTSPDGISLIGNANDDIIYVISGYGK